MQTTTLTQNAIRTRKPPVTLHAYSQPYCEVFTLAL